MLEVLMVILIYAIPLIFLIALIMAAMWGWQGKVRVYTGWGDFFRVMFLGIASTILTWIGILTIFNNSNWLIKIASVLLVIACQSIHVYNWRKTKAINPNISKAKLIITFLGRIALTFIIPMMMFSAFGGYSSKRDDNAGQVVVNAAIGTAILVGLWKLVNRLVKGK